MECEICGGRTVRIPREGIRERLLYRAKFQCTGCKTTYLYDRPGLEFLSRHFSAVTHCPRCGTQDVTSSRKRDGIDRFYKNPLSLIQALFGAPIRHCHFCRIQYYDFRPRAKVITKPGATFGPLAAPPKNKETGANKSKGAFNGER